MARKPQQCARDGEQLAQAGFVRVQANFDQAFVQQLGAVPPLLVFGQGIDGGQRQAQGFAHVAQGAAGVVGGHGSGQGSAVAPVFGVEVLDDLFAPLVLKVHIDVGRLVALLADETLEQQGGLRRVDLGDAQAVADRRVGGRAPALAQNLAAARLGHHVVHGQKVRLIAQLGDEGQLLLKLRAHVARHALRVSLCRATQGELAQVAAGGLAGRHHLVWVLITQFGQLEPAQVGDALRFDQQFARVNQRQTQAAAQVGLGVGAQGKTTIGHGPVFADGGHHVQHRLAAAHVHERAASGHQRQAGGLGGGCQAIQPQGIV